MLGTISMALNAQAGHEMVAGLGYFPALRCTQTADMNATLVSFSVIFSEFPLAMFHDAPVAVWPTSSFGTFSDCRTF